MRAISPSVPTISPAADRLNQDLDDVDVLIDIIYRKDVYGHD